MKLEGVNNNKFKNFNQKSNFYTFMVEKVYQEAQWHMGMSSALYPLTVGFGVQILASDNFFLDHLPMLQDSNKLFIILSDPYRNQSGIGT